MKRVQLIHSSLLGLPFDSIFCNFVVRILDISLCDLSSGYLQGELHESSSDASICGIGALQILSAGG